MISLQVVLCFEQRFWDSHVHLFGHVATGTVSRGELFMFWHLSHAPVLIALLAGLVLSLSPECEVRVVFHAGEDAVRFEGLSDDVVVAKAVAVLRSIFGDPIVPEVIQSVLH